MVVFVFAPRRLQSSQVARQLECAGPGISIEIGLEHFVKVPCLHRKPGFCWLMIILCKHSRKLCPFNQHTNGFIWSAANKIYATASTAYGKIGGIGDIGIATQRVTANHFGLHLHVNVKWAEKPREISGENHISIEIGLPICISARNWLLREFAYASLAIVWRKCHWKLATLVRCLLYSLRLQAWCVQSQCHLIKICIAH